MVFPAFQELEEPPRPHHIRPQRLAPPPKLAVRCDEGRLIRSTR